MLDLSKPFDVEQTPFESGVRGRYGPDGIKLSEARELLLEAKKTLRPGGGRQPTKARGAARKKAENTFGGVVPDRAR